MGNKDFLENIHYYLDSGSVVFTQYYHLQRGYCCGNKCRHCPYDPEHVKGNKNTQQIDFKDRESFFIFKKKL